MDSATSPPMHGVSHPSDVVLSSVVVDISPAADVRDPPTYNVLIDVQDVAPSDQVVPQLR